MAFTTLVLFQMFNVLNARSDEHSAFRGLFTNRWLWARCRLVGRPAVGVVTVPVLQQAFSTTALSVDDWLRCTIIASTVLWFRELEKAIGRLVRRLRRAPATGN